MIYSLAIAGFALYLGEYCLPGLTLVTLVFTFGVVQVPMTSLLVMGLCISQFPVFTHPHPLYMRGFPIIQNHITVEPQVSP